MYTVVAVYRYREDDHYVRRAQSTHRTIGGATAAAIYYYRTDGNPDNHYEVTNDKGVTVYSTDPKEPF